MSLLLSWPFVRSARLRLQRLSAGVEPPAVDAEHEQNLSTNVEDATTGSRKVFSSSASWTPASLKEPPETGTREGTELVACNAPACSPHSSPQPPPRRTRIASSKTSLRPFCVSAEHSMYLTAPISCRQARARVEGAATARPATPLSHLRGAGRPSGRAGTSLRRAALRQTPR